ncbi:hypothetical protein B0H19DRAFT_1142757 [Mycena capillaripes]|nr:hypothetical protein B0H19DRAFT_1142757 [Mycena capillaripes]
MSEEPFTPEEEFLMEALGEMVIPPAILFSDIAFSEPLRPKYCAQFLHGVWLRMFASEDEGAIPAAFHFIVCSRTEVEMTSLLDGMSRCRCAPADPHDKLETGWIEAFHDIGAEAQLETAAIGGSLALPTHFHAVMQIISIRILQTLRKTNPVKLAKLKGRQEWPASLDDIILPTIGPNMTVKSLEQWTRHMSFVSPWPIQLLGSIASICCSLILPAILQSPTLIPTILRITGEICDDAAPHLSSRFSKSKITEATGQLVSRLRPITTFFHDTFQMSGGGPAMLDNFPVERKTVIVQMCGRVIEMLRSPLVVKYAAKEDRIMLIKDFTNHLTLFLDVGVDTDGIDPTLIQEAVHTLDRVHDPPLTIIRLLLIAWKQSLRCYAMSCEKSLQTSQTFKRCSVCKVVSYCGTECQRRAWHIHKPLCKIIAKIIRDGGGDLESEIFKQNCDMGKVDAEDAEEIVAAYSTWRRTHGQVHL